MTLFRSFLFAPGNNAKLLDRVWDAGADAIVLDLEDSVPSGEKARARDLTASILRRHDLRPGVFVRINSLQGDHWRKDIEAVAGKSLTGVRVPKAESLEDLVRLHHVLSQAEEHASIPPGAIVIIPTIESARGLSTMRDIARAPRVVGLALGATDLSADLGCDPFDLTAGRGLRQELVVASRVAGLQPPIASVFTRIGASDDADFRSDTLAHQAIGFFGRSLIHPRQVPIVNEVFTPQADQVARARSDLALFVAATARGEGVLRDENQFFDPAVLRRAQRLVDLAEAFGTK